MGKMNHFLSFLVSVAFIFGGVYCFMQPAAALLTIAWFVGLTLLVSGIFGVFSYVQLPREMRVVWGLLVSIIDIFFGIWFMTVQGLMMAAVLLPIIFAINMILRGVFSIIQYREIQEILRYKTFYIISACIQIALGVFLLSNLSLAAMTMVYVIGFNLLFFAFTSMVIWDGIRHIGNGEGQE